jgi:uncharacterized protein YaaN involved in tellurite resistance
MTAQELEKGKLVAYAEAPPARKADIERLMDEIDIKDSNSIIYFGTKAQEQLTTVSDTMLEGVRNKDTGQAGEALNSMLATLRGFDVSDIDPSKKPGFFARLFGKITPVAKFLQRYEQVRRQIDAVTDRLEGHTTKLLTDIASLDRLYDANLDYFHILADYIAAGEELLQRLDRETIPALAREAEGTTDVLKAQELRDLRAARDDLERRVHDLKLTRQVAMQSLPSIRLVQENDKSLVSKIRSTLANTVPLWRQQLALAVTIARSSEAGKTLKEATDLTNELLTANAETLRTSNQQIREQVERGVFDIEAVKKANDALIATIEDSLRIADEGKRKRREAETTLVQLEGELKSTLQAAKAKAEGAPPPARRA